MPIIKTTNFELAVYAAGSESSSKFALVLPGRLDTKDYPHMRAHVDFLASKGYYALSFDPPGTWGSPGGIGLYTTKNCLNAIDELITYYGNKPTIVMGHSRGGTIALLSGIRNGYVTHIVSVMSVFGPGRAPLITEEKTVYRDATNGSANKVCFKLPVSYFREAVKYDYSGLGSLRKPKLFIAGLKDDVVSPQSVRADYELAGGPKQLHDINYGHDYRRSHEAINEINTVVHKFLQHKK